MTRHPTAPAAGLVAGGVTKILGGRIGPAGPRLAVALVLAAAMACALGAGATDLLAQAPQAAGPKAAATLAQAKPAKPWPPDAETLRARRAEAEALPLFQGFEPIEVTITADFRTVQRDRDVDSKKLYPGTLSIVTGGAAGPAIPIQLRTRGHVRRNVRLCSFAPLRLEFKKSDVKGTVFQGQTAVKLGTHCQGDDIYRQYGLKEYLANRLYNVLTPRSVRARLAEVTYADTAPGKKPFTKLGIFFEDEDDVAKRMEGREEARQGLMFGQVDRATLLLMSLFQYMIGNTDYSILKLHNVFIISGADGRRYTVPYDFDYSGLVDAHYAVVTKELGLASVHDRMYRGPCAPEAALRPTVDQFLAKKEELLALPLAMPGLEEKHQRDAVKYLNEFFETVSRPDRVTRVFLKDCNPIGGM
jgi:hypothetical protein